ncbi:MAG: hypothetical protein AABZ12_12565 [Planctomycetota bacterium]
MNPDAAKALQHEADFLSAVEANFETAKGRILRGSIWERVRQDDRDRLRALLAERGMPNRELLTSLPSNERVILRGYDRRLFFWRKPTGVAVASVLSPLSYYAGSRGGSPPLIGLGELADHVKKLVGHSTVPHLIGVCSPTGFTEEAQRARLDTANATVVLVEPNGSGGWRTFANGDHVDPRVLKIFDPEGSKQKLARVRRLIDDHSGELLTGGLSASAIAREANLPEELIREGFEQSALEDPELRVAKKDGECLLYRGAPLGTPVKSTMNVIERIQRLFSGEGNEAAKINLLAERRAALSQRRDRIYDDIAKLEKKEADLHAQGTAAASAVPRRRLAAQIAQLRKDISRMNTSAGMLNQQINIISTDIHNLTLLQQGRMAELPDTHQLTEHAVAAEEMLETLKADADLVGQLETGMEQTLVSEDELAILKEFEEPTPSAKAAEDVSTPKERPAAQRTAPPKVAVDKTPTRPTADREPIADEPSGGRERRREDPEVT